MADRWDDLGDDELHSRLFHRLLARGHQSPGARATHLVERREREHEAATIEEILT